jgi:hypothetical protein
MPPVTRRIVRWGLRLIALVTLGLLLHGPLFVWLPVAPGFVRERQDVVVVLRRPGAAVTPAHGRFGAAARAVEASLGLSFTQPVPIVLCDAWGDLRRFMPWLPVNRGLGARTLPIGHVVYVTPLVRDRADADVFVRHELVHVLLHQHMPFMQRLDGGKPAWLIEGVATYFGNPGSYPAGDLLADRLRSVGVARLLREGPGAPGGPTLFYAESRDFVASLVQRHGADRFRTFLARYVRAPAQWPSAFMEVFGATFDSALAEFAHRAR